MWLCAGSLLEVSMGKYIIKRILMMIPVVFFVCILVFTIMYFTPGDPAAIILGSNATEIQLEELRESMGLNDPYIVRLGRYLYQIFLKFDFGDSYITGTSVTSELLARLPRTLLLDLIAIVISVGVGIPLGITAAVNQNKAGDYISMFIALLCVSMPAFWFALVLVLIFSNTLHLLPSHGMGGIEYWILPIISCSFQGVAAQARQARSSMLEVIHSDYVVMAKAKGVKKRDVIYKHALPNALIPMITIAGSDFGRMLGGTLVIETVFSIPGVGYYIVNAVNNRDYPVVQGGVIVLAVCFSIIMLIADLFMAYVDPRIRSQFAAGKRRRIKKDGK